MLNSIILSLVVSTSPATITETNTVSIEKIANTAVTSYKKAEKSNVENSMYRRSTRRF